MMEYVVIRRSDVDLMMICVDLMGIGEEEKRKKDEKKKMKQNCRKMKELEESKSNGTRN